MKKVLIILRGIPGCGKSSFAELLDSYVCTADDYHMIDGKYVWKSENASKAHFECRSKCEQLMKRESSKIVIANTNTTMKEMGPYYDMAKKYGYKVFSVIVENRHNGISDHNVPEETLQKMRDRFDIKL
jgi:predicted kinase